MPTVTTARSASVLAEIVSIAALMPTHTGAVATAGHSYDGVVDDWRVGRRSSRRGSSASHCGVDDDSDASVAAVTTLRARSAAMTRAAAQIVPMAAAVSAVRALCVCLRFA
jgi:hypothetical protein